jgi:hypothetical protein
LLSLSRYNGLEKEGLTMRSLIRSLLIFVFLVFGAVAQELPPAIGLSSHRLFFYDASNNLEYVCWTQSQNATATFTRAATTLTNIVDSGTTATATTASAHGLTTGATVVVTGATVDADLNSTAVITVTGTTTFTFTSASVADATYTEATLVVTYSGPRDTSAIWAIQKFFYNASNYLVKAAWATGSPANTRICANRATYQYR